MVNCLRTLAVLSLATAAFGEDFSGKWMLSANGSPVYELHFFQTGTQVRGWMRATGASALDDTVTGTVKGREINWQRSGLGLPVPQQYRGFLFELQGNAMAGVFSHRGALEYGWYALRAGAAQSAPASPATSIGGWTNAGTGDCPGRDVANSTGPNPDPSKCTTQFAGFTAVCWSGSCTYKNLATRSCTGGASPGRMYTCSAAAAVVVPVATPAPPPVSATSWNSAGTGDCPGRDVANSKGPNPDPSKCTAQFAGFTAVCWSGECTYKNLATGSCTGGASPGRMYTCATASAPAPPTVSAEGWKSVGTGDCPGRDVANSNGSNPDPSKCTAPFAGFTAVCWTGGCTYKNLATGSCTGGSNPGRMYTCEAQR